MLYLNLICWWLAKFGQSHISDHVNGYFIARPLFHGKIGGRRGQDGLLQLTGSCGCAVNKSIVGLLKSHEPLTSLYHLLQAMNCSRQPAFLAVRRSPFWPLLWIRCMLRTLQMSKRGKVWSGTLFPARSPFSFSASEESPPKPDLVVTSFSTYRQSCSHVGCISQQLDSNWMQSES